MYIFNKTKIHLDAANAMKTITNITRMTDGTTAGDASIEYNNLRLTRLKSRTCISDE